MDSQTVITLALGTTTLILLFATVYCLTRSTEEAKHGSLSRAVLWMGGFASLASAAMYAGALAMVKGIGIG